jgi:hypothetical protein
MADLIRSLDVEEKGRAKTPMEKELSLLVLV